MIFSPSSSPLMSHNRDSPVQTQMAVTALRSPLRNNRQVSNKMEGTPAGRRRVFVQTETGFVLGMELDRSDNAHTVKKKLQVALNVPIDGRSLTFGDKVLNNDLTTIRKDSPLLLTRNLLHRSVSTPCLRPAEKEAKPKDQSGPIEILGRSDYFLKTKQIVKDIVKGIKIGVEPLPIDNGLGGAYFFRNSRGESVAIVKPTDEEPFAPNNPKGFVGKALGQPGLKHSVRVGETGFREVAAYLLDYDHFANVPPTALVKITHSVFNVNDEVKGNNLDYKKNPVSKIASLQQYISHDYDASDHGTSSFPVSSVHRIGVLDIRIFNTDRHAGNLLVKKLDGVGRFGQVELIPIDHGLCLPETLEDPYFEWIHWPQASIPFSEDELEYIEKLDPVLDSEMLRAELPMIREACLRVLVLCTVFLKEAAAFGLCLAEIGEMMTREFRGGEEDPSEFEFVCIEALKLIEESKVFSSKPEIEEDKDFIFDIECDEEEMEISKKGEPFQFGPLSKLEENIEEEEEEEESFVDLPLREKIPSVSNITMSLKNTILGEKNKKQMKFSGAKSQLGYMTNSSSGHRSANEQLPVSPTFVNIGEISDNDWAVFLEKFEELLYPALEKRKLISANQKQKQRLGTSCQF